MFLAVVVTCPEVRGYVVPGSMVRGLMFSSPNGMREEGILMWHARKKLDSTTT